MNNMILIYGFVCVGMNSQDNLNVLYGATHNKLKPEPFFENINPFNSLDLAMNSKKILEKRIVSGFEEIKIGKLRMKIAENIEEIAKLEHKDIVVIAEDSFFGIPEYKLYGDVRPGSRQLGELLYQNGLKLYQSMDKAQKMASQLQREAEISSKIANFKLEYVN